jgi:acetyl-CoA carboxylase carboxyl transferase subunit beta
MKTKANDLRYLNPSLGLAEVPETVTAPGKEKMARRKGSAPASSKCPACGTVHSRAVLEENLYVCPQCKHHLSMPSHARIATLVDEGTFIELDHSLVSVDPLEFADLRSYRARLQEARRETGVREAVTTGLCKIGGQRAVLVVFDFAFLGGTMGSVVGEKIAHRPDIWRRYRKLRFAR